MMDDDSAKILARLGDTVIHVPATATTPEGYWPATALTHAGPFVQWDDYADDWSGWSAYLRSYPVEDASASFDTLSEALEWLDAEMRHLKSQSTRKGRNARRVV